MDFIKKYLVSRAMKEKSERYNTLAHKLYCSNVEVACAEYIMGAAHMDSVTYVNQGMSNDQLRKYTHLVHLMSIR